MPEYDWRRVRSRDFYALGFGALLSIFPFLGDGYLPPHLVPCPSSSWRDVALFFVVLSLGVALVEGLNWVGWLIAYELRQRATSGDKSELSPGDLLIPCGWVGLILGLVLLITPYVLRDPSQCQPFYLGRVSVPYFVGALMLAYGTVLVGQLFRDAQSRVASQKLQ